MKKINQKSILGIFDSGVGGLSVLKEIRKTTDADIIYFGDCARAPYGNRSEGEIVLFIKEVLAYLQSKGVTHFVSACNSMSVLTTKKLLRDIGVVKANYVDMVTAVKIIPFEENTLVLIIGTKATLSSLVYQTILEEKKISFEVFCPITLAGNIEKGETNATRDDIHEILMYATKIKASYILYACTHYPLVDDIFKEQAYRNVWMGTFIDPSSYVALKVKDWNLGGNISLLFETSLDTDVFKKYVKIIEREEIY